MADADRPDDDTHAESEPASGDAAWAKLVDQLSAHSPKTSRYKLEGEIARGGMGAIVKVWDEDLRRHLAMKVVLGRTLPGDQGSTPAVDDRTLGRFLEEAQVTGQLDHPGVVPVYELGIDDQGLVYFTMRLVKGRDLKTIFGLVREEKDGWNQTRALGVLLKACEALAYAHSKGVIHRDLKPANIMVGRFGEVYVMDWGLARVVGRPDRKDIRLQAEGATSVGSLKTVRRDAAEETPDSPLVTMDGDVVGTPAYMAPEQARGDVEQVDARSDVYAMGAILYELLTGQMPYVPPGEKRSQRTILAAVLEGPPRAVHDVARGVPLEVEAICEKSMARDAGGRYRNVLELAEDLRSYMEGRVVKAHRTGAVIELRKWVQRNKGLAVACVAAFLATLGGLIVASAGYAEARTQAKTARLQSYVANILSVAVNLDAGHIAEAHRRLQACPEELRGFEWGHLSLRPEESSRRIETSQSTLYSLAYSLDGTRLASAGVGSVRLWNEVDDEALAEMRWPKRMVLSVAFSPDGTLLAASGEEGTVRLWDTVGENVVATLTGHEGWVRSVAFAPIGNLLASAGEDGSVRLWDAKSGRALSKLSGHVGQVNAVAFAPDGRRLASAGDDVRLWDVTNAEELETLTGHAGWVFSVAFSPDGHRLASAGADGSVRMWDTANGEALAILKGHEGSVWSVVFSPDGTRIASSGEDGSVRLWEATNGEAVAKLTGFGGRRLSVVFSPDGTCLAATGMESELCLWFSKARAGVLQSHDR